MQFVLLMCHPFEIGDAVVPLVTVTVIDLRALEPRACQPCESDQPVNEVCFPLNGNAHVVRSTSPDGGRELQDFAGDDLAVLPVAMPDIDRARFASDQPGVRGFIHR